MVDSIDDIFRQARQGSIAAVIQILNEKLVDVGVRTRAVFADGALQLLCEAATPEQLDQSKLVKRIRHILEAIGPRNVRKVKINSRIVREQQLLWLEEIRRDPEGQLLWSELITLKQPNPIQRFLENQKFKQQRGVFLPSSSSKSSPSNVYFLRGLLGGIGLILILGLVGWAMQDWLNLDRWQAQDATDPELPAPTGAPTSAQDPFAQAVEIATQASVEGTQAQTPTDWLDLATRWQRASDLMAQVPASDSRYGTAQAKVKEYQANSALALQKAERVRSQ